MRRLRYLPRLAPFAKPWNPMAPIHVQGCSSPKLCSTFTKRCCNELESHRRKLEAWTSCTARKVQALRRISKDAVRKGRRLDEHQ